MAASTSCDACKRKAGTLYDLNNKLICLDCVPGEYIRLNRVLKLARAAVTGEVNIERRRRAIKKRA